MSRGRAAAQEPLGDWRWYYGSSDDDDEMCDCGTRENAIRDGLREYRRGETFWLVEARMTIADEEAMGRGELDSAPFAETRNGVWVSVGDNGEPIEGVA